MSLGLIASQAGTPMPAPVNNKWIFVADSRGSSSTEVTTTAFPQRTTAQGGAGWIQLFSQYRGKFVGNYGINTDTTQGVINRLTGAGISGGSAPADPRRGWINVYDPGLSAGAFLLLIGVNDSIEPISTWGPKYDSIAMGLCDNANGGPARVGLLASELPNSDQSGQGAANVLRKAYIAGWPYTSAGMSAGQKATYAAKVRAINAYDTLVDPAVPYSPRAGMYPTGDLLHPADGGWSRAARVIGPALAQLMAAGGFPARDALLSDTDSLTPNWQMTGSVAIAAANGEAAGAGGSNMNGQGGQSVRGVLPTNWTAGRSTTIQTLLNAAQPVSGHQLDVVCETVADGANGKCRVAITGQVGSVGATLYTLAFGLADRFVTAAGLANLNAGVGLADGDTVAGCCYVELEPGSTGITGFGPEGCVTSTAYTSTSYASLSGSIASSGHSSDQLGRVSRFQMSQPQVVPAGFAATVETKTIRNKFIVYLAGGMPVNAVFTISRLGLVKNR